MPQLQVRILLPYYLLLNEVTARLLKRGRSLSRSRTSARVGPSARRGRSVRQVGGTRRKTGGYDRAERAALGKLLGNWRCVMENVESRDDRADRKTGQRRLF